MQKVRVAQTGRMIRQALLVDEQREPNARIVPEQPRVGCVAQSDGRQVGAPLVESLLMFAQLRDVLTAENSTVVGQKDHYRRLPLPKRTQPDRLSVRIGQYDRCKRFGNHLQKVYCFRTHTESIISGNGIMLSGRGAAPGNPAMP